MHTGVEGGAIAREGSVARQGEGTGAGRGWGVVELQGEYVDFEEEFAGEGEKWGRHCLERELDDEEGEL